MGVTRTNIIEKMPQNQHQFMITMCKAIFSRVTAILLDWWILFIGEASAVEGLLSTGPTLSSFSYSNPSEITKVGKFQLKKNPL